jgi:uncharacterized protein YndB with AHSA1/START domain
MPILLALALIVFLLIVVIAGRPGDFEVFRETRISAPPELVFPHVNELRKWQDWSPWAKLDPHAKSTFEGPAAGVGSSMAWDGNKKVGAGKMTIVESWPNEYVHIELEFLRPFQAKNTAEFRFQPHSDQTFVKWSMFGKNNFFFKVFMDCNAMIGKDFEKGLASLKLVAEK